MLGATLGAASIQAATSAGTNNAQINFQESLVDRGEKSFTNAGLPSFMYWGGNKSDQSLPNTQYHVGGSNFSQAIGVNANLPIISTNPYQQAEHGAMPKNIGGNKASIMNSKVGGPGLGYKDPNQTIPMKTYNTGSNNIPMQTFSSNANNVEMRNFGSSPSSSFPKTSLEPNWTPGGYVNPSSALSQINSRTTSSALRGTGFYSSANSNMTSVTPKDSYNAVPPPQNYNTRVFTNSNRK